MRYVSIDIETTGLDESRCAILQIGAVLEDTADPQPVEDLPSFEVLVNPGPVLSGEPYALQMNAGLLRRVADGEGVSPTLAFIELEDWLLDVAGFRKDARGTLAGKNVANFDLRFLRRHPGWRDDLFYHRSLDPGSLYFDPRTDERVPSTEECMARAGLSGVVTHDAVEDARLVVRLLRHRLGYAD